MTKSLRCWSSSSSAWQSNLYGILTYRSKATGTSARNAVVPVARCSQSRDCCIGNHLLVFVVSPLVSSHFQTENVLRERSFHSIHLPRSECHPKLWLLYSLSEKSKCIASVWNRCCMTWSAKWHMSSFWINAITFFISDSGTQKARRLIVKNRSSFLSNVKYISHLCAIYACIIPAEPISIS